MCSKKSCSDGDIFNFSRNVPPYILYNEKGVTISIYALAIHVNNHIEPLSFLMFFFLEQYLNTNPHHYVMLIHHEQTSRKNLTGLLPN